jgi:hypothetical protein
MSQYKQMVSFQIRVTLTIPRTEFFYFSPAVNNAAVWERVPTGGFTIPAASA